MSFTTASWSRRPPAGRAPTLRGLLCLGLRKRYGEHESLTDVNLAVGRGELVAVLGASGAGKTTILRLIAGHLEPDAGEIRIGGESMQGVPPERREVGMVFQNYALFPHLTVRRNVAFGPERRGASRGEAGEIADAMIGRLGLGDLAGRYPPPALRRRGAAGRRRPGPRDPPRGAAARRAAFEPRRRASPRSAGPAAKPPAGLRRHHRVGDPTTRRRRSPSPTGVAVLQGGRIRQIGTPLDLHTRPSDEFVATFVGKMNLLPADAAPGTARGFRLAGGPVVQVAADTATGPRAGVRGTVGMRPEVVQIGHPPPTPGFNTAAAEVKRIAFLGDRLEIELEIGGGRRLLARGNTLFQSRAREGDRVRIYWPVAETRLL